MKTSHFSINGIRQRRMFITGIMVAILAPALMPGASVSAFINPVIPTKVRFDPQAIASDGGGRLAVTVAFDCPGAVKNSDFQIEVSVLQQSTQAVFRGATVGRCRHSSGPFTIEGPVELGGPPFQPGSALACALAATGRGAPINSVTHWCSFVTIVEP